MEHWAKLLGELKLRKMMNTHKPAIFFINTEFCKNRPYGLKAQSVKPLIIDRGRTKKSTLRCLNKALKPQVEWVRR